MSGYVASAATNEGETLSDNSSDSGCMSEDMISAADPISHMTAAIAADSFENKSARPLTHQQKHLISTLASDPVSFHKSAEKSLKFWRKRKEELAQGNVEFKERVPPELRGTLGRLDPFMIGEMTAAAGHVDSKYVHDLLGGFPVTGEVS